MLNWMVKTSLIGGIYNRPIAVANFTHFAVVGLSLAKALLSGASLPTMMTVAAIIYFIFAILFALILFRSPLIPAKK